VTKLWLLGDIPLIGRLFRHKSLREEQSDLVIFITPHIIDG
jgi:type II secretory pathway component HofQ